MQQEKKPFRTFCFCFVGTFNQAREKRYYCLL